MVSKKENAAAFEARGVPEIDQLGGKVNRESSLQTSRAQVIAAPFVRVERERDGHGWFVITAKGHAWLHGSRAGALADKRWHDRQWGRP